MSNSSDSADENPLNSSAKFPQSFVRPSDRQEALPASGKLASSFESRTGKRGELRVKNSDDESDSDSSLEDLPSLLSLNKSPAKRPAVPATTPLAAWTAGAGSALKDTQLRRVHREPSPKYEFPIDVLAAQKREQSTADEAFQKALQAGKLSDSRISAAGSKWDESTASLNISSAITNVPHEDGDSDKGERLAQALERTEAFQVKRHWTFIRTSRQVTRVAEPELDDESFYAGVASGRGLEDSLLTGTLQLLARKGMLSDELLGWVVNTALSTPSPEVLEACNTIVSQLGSRIASKMNPDRISQLFIQAGATEDTVDCSKQIVPLPLSKDETHSVVDFSGMKAVLELLIQTATWAIADCWNRAFSLLLRLALDSRVQSEVDATDKVQRALVALVGALSPRSVSATFYKVIENLVQFLDDSSLRLQLLDALVSESPRLHLFRTSLALSFFYERAMLPDWELTPKSELSHIDMQLRSNRDLIVERDTDYQRFNNAIRIVDVGCGERVPATQAGVGATEFDRDVDTVAATLKEKFRQIRDAGANHAMRSEAKESLEIFQSRLQYAVRTKAPPKKSVFESGFSGSGSSVVMESFVRYGSK